MVHGLLEFLTLLAVASKFICRATRAGLLVSVLFTSIILSACVAPIAAIGASGMAASSTAGTSIATAAVANPVTAASLASTATTGKSPLEHAASAATKKECSLFNLIGSQVICIEVTVPNVTDNSSPLLGPADQVLEATK
jgi:hypothetical protein